MIEKYLDAFPFSNTYIPEGSRFAFYLQEVNGGRKLTKLDLEKSHNYCDGVVICQEDFSKRSYRAIRLHEQSNLLYLVSDDDNKENYNIFTVDINTGEFNQVTHTSYCGVHSFNEDMTKLVYGDRYKTHEGKFYTKLYIRDMLSGEEELLADDADWEYRFSWSRVKFDEDENNIYFSLDKDNLRKFTNVFTINLDSKECKSLIPKEFECDYIGVFGNKIKNNELYYVCAPEGQDDIYHLDLSSFEVTRLTQHNDNVSSFFVGRDNRTAYVTLERNSENKTLFMQYELTGKKISRSKEIFLDGVHSFIHSKDLWLHSTAIDNPGTFTRYHLDKEFELVKEYSLSNLVGDRDNLIHCSYKFVEYPTFDNEMVPAFLSLPKNEVKGAMIISFYGGSNDYSWRTQLLAENGIAVLSPGVRGSWNYGKQWREKILGDLGGDEILDVHWGARYLEKELGLKPSQIGVYGGSHGGYATLRAMTMPADFKKGVDCSYPYGFGICSAGFADLEDFYLTSNIPDWLVNMLGPYEGNESKYKERSPIHYFENLKSPLLVSHGHNDARVSASSMEGFIDKLKSSDKDYVLHLKEGIGHGSGDKIEQLKEYKKWVNFIDEVCAQ